LQPNQQQGMKKTIYFDNAATTSLDPRVLEAMSPYLTEIYGNGSSIHMMGRKAKAAIENARKKVATLLNTSPSEIFFTSGGTEASNTILRQAEASLGIKNFISSPLEHHAIIHPLEALREKQSAQVHFVELENNGNISYNSLENLLANHQPALVSLMHGNNEIGNMLNIQHVSALCKEYKALFHSDTVQTIGKFPIDLQQWDIDFINGSAHKFHGPKGIGFLYINSRNRIDPFILGGAQERNMRGGTENIAGIIGLAAALEIALEERENRKEKILTLKEYLKTALAGMIPGITFNGTSGDLENSLYHVLNASFPQHPDNEMLLFSLDIEGICVSGGSACSSGTDIGSHVLTALNVPDERANIRFSFSKHNTIEEADEVIKILARILTAS
jgi:cysteine desulfurase